MNDKTIRFGTDGIRGNATQFPFTSPATQQLGHAIGTWGALKYQNPTALIGSDTRASCATIKQALCEGLRAAGVRCIDAGVLPTPAILGLINGDPTLHMGIMISASHNAYHDNGIKLFDRTTGKISQEDEQAIEHNFAQAPEVRTTPQQSESSGAQRELYVQSILSHFEHNFLASHTIALDCANGATYAVAPQILSALGAKVVTIADAPNGTNINANCGTLHPYQLQQAVLSHNALAGFAFDGDGDRVIAVNRSGVLKDGDDLLALLLDHPACAQSTHVVGTIMTNHGLEAHVKARGLQLTRTKVGDKHIAAQLIKTNQVLGGEGSGHVIMTDYLPTGDGIFVALRALQTMLATNNHDLTTFNKYPQKLINVPVARKDNLQAAPYHDIIARHEQLVPAGRIVVRYSGTENLLRVMVEDERKESAHTTAASLARELQTQLEN